MSMNSFTGHHLLLSWSLKIHVFYMKSVLSSTHQSRTWDAPISSTAVSLATRVQSVQFSSVTQSHLTLCDPIDCSTPSPPVHNQLPELAQTHAHWVSDTIQPSNPCCPLLLLPLISPSIRVFTSESALHFRWPKYQRFSFSISFSN